MVSRLETLQLKSCQSIYSIVFCSRLDTVSEAISGRFVRLVVPDNAVEFRDPLLNLSRNIYLKVIESCIFFIVFFFCNNFRPEVASDVLSGVV